MLEGLEEKTISNSNETVPAIGGALASLMANYSDSEEDRPSQTDKHTGQSLSSCDNVAVSDFLNFDISGRRLRLHRISAMAQQQE